MPPTPEDIDAARAQPHPDDVNVAQEIVGDHLESQVFGTVTGRLSSDRIARALSAARERGAREQADREPLHRAIVEAAMRWYDEPYKALSASDLLAAVRALREATK